LFAILSQSLVKSIIVVHYQVNKTAITKKYCENKAKPKMHCDGKCHLKKQLQKEEKREQAPISKDAKEKFESLAANESLYVLKETPPLKIRAHNNYSFSIITSHQKGLLQPPKC